MRVLVADDSASFRRLLVAALTEAGDDPTEVTDGLAALEQLALGGFDGVITDGEMPGASGLDVVALASTLGIPVVLFSTDAEMGACAITVGAAFVHKSSPAIAVVAELHRLAER
jgi:CheY-like chemotaxis protein